MTSSAKEVIAKTAGDYYDGYADPADTPENWSRGLGCANDILSALNAAGYVVAPREPTKAMIDGINAGDFPAASIRRARSIYRAMIAAQEQE